MRSGMTARDYINEMLTIRKPSLSCDNNITKKKVKGQKLTKNTKIFISLHSNLTCLETIKMDKTYINGFLW